VKGRLVAVGSAAVPVAILKKNMTMQCNQLPQNKYLFKSMQKFKKKNLLKNFVL
jgi:hypothetical protein